ncbi:hypothetical protein BaRGS_00002520 [Batillaria attramentaria]|uniref:Uncharacterized protein n=1 Tax=Batillaria attramentaria TaxID=370345 RepID=A0ABD0M3Z0_9CAEN
MFLLVRHHKVKGHGVPQSKRKAFLLGCKVPLTVISQCRATEVVSQRFHTARAHCVLKRATRHIDLAPFFHRFGKSGIASQCGRVEREPFVNAAAIGRATTHALEGYFGGAPREHVSQVR